jgi:hypothetical protein
VTAARPLWLLSLIAALSAVPVASAQPLAPPVSETSSAGVAWDEADKAQTFQATQLYKAALEDFNRKRFEPALEKFRRSYAVVKSPNSRLMIVRSLANLERNLEAYYEALTLRLEAEEAAGKSEKYAAALIAAQDEIDALETKLALVVVDAKAPPSARLTVNGEPLLPERWGDAFVVEPGPLLVVLTTETGEVHESAEARVGEKLTLTLVPRPAPRPVPRVAPPPEAPPDDGGYGGPDRKVLALVAGSIGVVGVVNFGIFGMLSNGQLERLEIRCDRRQCDPELEEEADKGRTYQTVANVSLGVGAPFLAAGAGLLLWDLLDAPDEDAASAARLTVGPGSLGLSGSF